MIARITDARRIGVIATLLLGAVGCGVHSHMNLTTGVPGYQSDTQSIEMISAVVGGKNIFIPSTVVVTGGAPQTLSVFNTTDKPHGFVIPGLDVQVVLLAGEETQIDLPPLAGGEIYRIGCHLHPPHRSATLVVVPGR
jgi:uncharacterized membrane protein YeaQ/YmgE (transglycosylase-associated protein family)